MMGNLLGVLAVVGCFVCASASAATKECYWIDDKHGGYLLCIEDGVIQPEIDNEEPS